MIPSVKKQKTFKVKPGTDHKSKKMIPVMAIILSSEKK